ncbi:MAG: hypothetical protein CMJ06_02180 [Pelagibacterales bacterium]|nr:hypothetical protein [Pelagibacterales bacterium]OUU63225.1 MAG: hypothetical protein CBC22_02150 [Alphaproteobacteria bacterium TMED62]|tara:strand:- start:25055 stop:26131 length:1077 start_codon:yes stop_codon:yes gene_type:complete
MIKKRALIILPSNTVGGAEKVICSYFNNFKDSKISLKLLVINNKDKINKLKNRNVINLNYSRFIFSIPKVLNIIKNNKIKIVISTFPNISAILLMLKYFNIIDIKIIVRQPNIIEKSLRGSLKLQLLRNTYKFFIKFTDAVIVTSEFMKEEILKYKVNKKKVFLLRNPISIHQIRKGIKPIRLGKDKVKLIFVGRLVYQKGIDRILHLFINNKNIELIIVGDGKLRSQLSKKVKDLDIEDNIKFLGELSEPYSLIAGSDYFMLPSRWEGLPNSVLESLALGTPVLSTKQIYSLYDFKNNISNKSIRLYNNIKDLSNKISTLKKRKDYKNPKLRKSLLIENISPATFNDKLNQIIYKII